MDGEHHPLLRFAHPDLPRSQFRSLQRHLVEVDLRAAAPIQCYLPDDAAQPAAAKVLQAAEQPLLCRVHARVYERFFRDWVTELHRAAMPFLDRFFRKIHRRESHSMYPVAPGLPANEYEDILRGFDPVLEQLRSLCEPDAPDVDDDVANITLVEDDAPRDCWQPDPVAIVPDSRHDAVEEVLGVFQSARQLLVGERRLSEVERVSEGDRLRAHGQDVSDDSADPSCGTAIRLDGARVVVRFDPDCICVFVIEGHDSRIPTIEDVRGLNGEDELLEEDLGGLVAAVLGPGLPERLQLDVCRVPALRPEIVADAVHLVDAQSEAEVLRHRLEFLVAGTEHVDVKQIEGDISFKVSVLNLPHPIGVIARP